MNKKSGQTILIVLLASALMLTLGMSLISQTVTDVNISTQEQEYNRAFNSTEAGIEELLSHDDGLAGLYSDVGNEACRDDPSAPCNPSLAGGNENEANYRFLMEAKGAGDVYEYPDLLRPGDAAQLNMDGYSGNEMTVYWTGTSSALELIFVYDASGTVSLYRILAGPPSGCIQDDQANSSSSGFSQERSYDQEYIISNTDYNNIFTNLKYIRVKPLCQNETYVAYGAEGGFTFPAQSYLAHVESRSGENTAAVEVEQSAEKSMPGIFDYALYAGSGSIGN